MLFTFVFTPVAPGVRVATFGASGDLTATLTRVSRPGSFGEGIRWEWRVETFGEIVDSGETFGTAAFPVARERATLALACLAPCFAG